jgi:hypothetical protein
MKHVFFFALVFATAACGGKIDSGLDGGNGADGGGPDGSHPPPGEAGADVVSPPPPCTPFTGGTTIGSDGSCEVTAAWACGDTQYAVDCRCPDGTCTCSEQTGSSGSGTFVQAPQVCPACTGASLPAICGFPSQ